MEKYGDGSQVERQRADTQEVSGDPRQFATNNSNKLAARSQLLINSKQFLNGEHVSDVIGQRCKIIQSIRVRDELGISHAFGDLFIAAVQITDVRPCPGNNLAIQLEHDAEHSMRRRMRWPHIEKHRFAM